MQVYGQVGRGVETYIGKIMDSKYRFLTAPAAARILGCGVEYIHQCIRSGELKAANFSVGGIRPRWKIDPAELQAFVDRKSNVQRSVDT